MVAPKMVRATKLAGAFFLALSFIHFELAFAQPAVLASSGEKIVATVVRDTMGTTSDGSVVERFTFTNEHGTILRVVSLGATVTELHVRDRAGDLADVVLGFDSVADYEANEPYMGCIIGRVGNRIADGRFELDGEVYQLKRNFGEHHIHGGEVGFHQRIWRAELIARADIPAVRFSYESPDGEEGYPGKLSVSVVYTLTDEDGVRIKYEATTDRPTPVNLTNHSYFNLGGHAAGTIFEHVLTLQAESATERGEDGIPTGLIEAVAGTPLDFRTPSRIGERIGELEVGYDHNFVLDHGGGATEQFFGEVFDPTSGRVMQLYTTEPGVQLYTSYYLSDTRGKSGVVYDQWQAFCLETQHYPDSVNKPEFPSIILRPGQRYAQTTEYRFSVQ